MLPPPSPIVRRRHCLSLLLFVVVVVRHRHCSSLSLFVVVVVCRRRCSSLSLFDIVVIFRRRRCSSSSLFVVVVGLGLGVALAYERRISICSVGCELSSKVYLHALIALGTDDRGHRNK